MKYLSNLTKKELNGETVLLRVDLNIKNEYLNSSDANLRVASIIPSIIFLVKNGAKVVILSHRGRPGKISSKQFLISNKDKKENTLEPFGKTLSKLLKKEVRFFEADFKNNKLINEKNLAEIDLAPKGSIFLLDNVRFFKGEEKNDKKFAKEISKIGTIYVNDAFAVSHRANASVEAITNFLPAYAGFLLEKEIKGLDLIMEKQSKPFVVILGGAKVSDKIGLVKNFISKADMFLTGGGIANTFMKSQNLPIGESIVDNKGLKFSAKIFETKKIFLPKDVVVENKKILDIGSETIDDYDKKISKAKTIIWNGPMGLIENKKFIKGSQAIAQAILKSKAYCVIGGGETATLFVGKKLPKNLFLSTGGGAMLEYLAGDKLPGIEVLK